MTSNQWVPCERVGQIEVRPYVHGDQARHEISISEADLKLPTLVGGFIARNPDNHADQWYIARDYFNEHYCIPVETTAPRALARGDEVTYTPLYGSKLPREGWKVEVLPKLTYVIKHPNGSLIAVDAAEITAVEPKESPLGRAVRIARGDTGPPTEPIRFAEKATERRPLWCCDKCNCYNGPRDTCAHCGAPRSSENGEASQS